MKINKRLIIGIIVIILIVVSIFYILNGLKKTKTQTPTESKISLSEITPGTTTEKEVLQDLGKPIASEGGVLQYTSTSPARNNEITIQDNKVGFIKEIVSYKDSTTLDQLEKQYGENGFLYGPDAINGYYLFYSPENGIAYLANPISRTVLEIWYFPKTTYQDFKLKWASNYSEKFVGEQ